MDKVIELLREINPDVDYTREQDLVGHGILDSLGTVMLVTGLEDAFGVTITPVDVVPENFRSAQTIRAMVTRLKAE